MEKKTKRHRKSPQEKLEELQANASKWGEKKKAADRELAAFRKKLNRDEEKKEISNYISAIKNFKKVNPKLFKQFDLKNLNLAVVFYTLLKKAYRNNLTFINKQGNFEINLNTNSLTQKEKNFFKEIAREILK